MSDVAKGPAVSAETVWAQAHDGVLVLPRGRAVYRYMYPTSTLNKFRVFETQARRAYLDAPDDSEQAEYDDSECAFVSPSMTHYVQDVPAFRAKYGAGGAVYPAAPADSEHSTAFKNDAGKPRWSLLYNGAPHALAAVVDVLTFAVRPAEEGGKGYIPHSWKQVPNAKERYTDALFRHLHKISIGELADEESGESHWAHVATNALFLAELNIAPEPMEEV